MARGARRRRCRSSQHQRGVTPGSELAPNLEARNFDASDPARRASIQRALDELIARHGIEGAAAAVDVAERGEPPLLGREAKRGESASSGGGRTTPSGGAHGSTQPAALRDAPTLPRVIGSHTFAGVRGAYTSRAIWASSTKWKVAPSAMVSLAATTM